MGVYDRYLSLRLRRQSEPLPERVAVIITERDLLTPSGYETLESFFSWAFEFDATQVIVYVSVLDTDAIPALERGLAELTPPQEMAIVTPQSQPPDAESVPISVSVGLGGTSEFTAAVQSLAEQAATGELDPAALAEEDIEAALAVPPEPDLMIKTGEERLADFMIWQSVYSELYFTDINWHRFRKRDYLRALSEYTDRQRRFGE